jgi:hydrogenase maturation protease
MAEVNTTHRPPPSVPASALVIGYGNVLRGDDGVGPQAARAVARWALPAVRVLELQQLAPELAEALAAARLTVFVDAGFAPLGQGVQVRRLEPAAGTLTLAHTSDPGGLLALTQSVYGRHPAAWAITVPAVHLELGEGLSPVAERGLLAALRHVARLLAGR